MSAHPVSAHHTPRQLTTQKPACHVSVPRQRNTATRQPPARTRDRTHRTRSSRPHHSLRKPVHTAPATTHSLRDNGLDHTTRTSLKEDAKTGLTLQV